MSGPAISVRGLRKRFGDKVVLDGIDFDVPAGSSLVVIGGSGSGKSVLVKCILGLIEPDGGSVAFDGVDILRLPAAERAAARRAPAALGRRWLELFHAALASADEDVTPRNLGVIARLDQRVAQALAEELLGTEPPAPALDCRAQLMRAMLEGSMNLPPESAACREMIEHTVERGMRLATAALRHRRATGDAGAQASA